MPKHFDIRSEHATGTCKIYVVPSDWWGKAELRPCTSGPSEWTSGAHTVPFKDHHSDKIWVSGLKKKRGKAIPVTGHEGPQGCETLRLTHGGEVVSLNVLAGHPLPPGRFLVLISVRRWVNTRAIVQLEGLGKLKSTVTSGIEPVTFWLVA
jgi:hypothetical protein